MGRDATTPRFGESESSPSPACLKSSPSFNGQDSSPSQAGISSPTVRVWVQVHMFAARVRMRVSTKLKISQL